MVNQDEHEGKTRKYKETEKQASKRRKCWIGWAGDGEGGVNWVLSNGFDNSYNNGSTWLC